MSEILCSKSGEYVYSRDSFCYIGVTDVVLNKLGKPVSYELPRTGEIYTKGEIFGYIEAEENATELFMPVSGKIEEINPKLKENINNLNILPVGENWILKVTSEFFDEDKKDLIKYNEYKEGK